ncbi:MAG: DUF1552 domain-containing protein [Planctomycetaceae bacterium]|nr:MAG: DUF1552 domain-containing protein [Planctomycetaceae bacterium]RPI90854.1 MAG: DUF1552 domain-containing protein [Planctomycetaceae bacterium]
MPDRTKPSRRAFLKGVGLGGAAIMVGLPAFEAFFNSNGAAYAAEEGLAAQPIETRFVLWFNGNGIVEKYWIPREAGDRFELPASLQPLARFQRDIHVLSGVDNAAARTSSAGNDHHKSMSGLVSCTGFTGRGAGGPSIDQAIAAQIGKDSRFRSLQIGVCQESFGESIQRNMSWADRDRPLPPEMLPHRLFDRLFGSKEHHWIERKKSILDAVSGEATSLKLQLGHADQQRLEEYLSSVRSLERSIASLPPEYSGNVQQPGEGGDLSDWPRIAKLQTDLLVHALASRQTRVASYMLTKCQGLSRFPWLGYTYQRHHEYTHTGIETPEGQRALRDICRWHVEEFAYLLAKLKSIPEGSGTLLDHTCALFVHEHAEANPHKNSGLAMIVAGHAGGLKTGRHTRVTGTVGDLYLTLAEESVGARIGRFPTGENKLSDIV